MSWVPFKQALGYVRILGSSSLLRALSGIYVGAIWRFRVEDLKGLGFGLWREYLGGSRPKKGCISGLDCWAPGFIRIWGWFLGPKNLGLGLTTCELLCCAS